MDLTSPEQTSLRIRPGLRVLQVIYQDPVNYPLTLNTARVLGDLGAKVLCLGFDRGQSASLPLPPSVRIQYLNLTKPSYLPGSTRFGSAIALRRGVEQASAQFQPDLVIGYDHWGGWAVLPLTRGKRTRTVLHVHDNVDRENSARWSSGRLVWSLVRGRVDSFSAVAVPDPQRADHLRSVWRISRAMHVVANSPPRGVRVPNDSLRHEIALRSGVRPPLLAIVLGNMGLYPETIRALAQAHAPWHLAVVGCGHSESIALMQREAERLGVRSRLHVFPYTDYDTTREWLRGCEVGLAFYPESSTNVNWRTMGSASVKVQEYLAAGIPSIVCSTRTFAALAQETQGIAMIEEESDRAIAQCLDRVEPGSETWRQLSQGAHAAHLRTYHCEAQLAPLIRALELDH